MLLTSPERMSPNSTMNSSFAQHPAALSKTELFARITALEEENETYRDIIYQWRSWYTNAYKPQILYLEGMIKALADPKNIEKHDISFKGVKPPKSPIAPPLPCVGSPKSGEMDAFYKTLNKTRGTGPRFLDKETLSYRKEKTFAEFLDRQSTTSYQAARQAALENRAAVDKLTEELYATGPNFAPGADVGKEFRAMLKRRYHCVRRAWNEVLDPMGVGRLGFFEFCSAVRAMGCACSMKKLWEFIARDDYIGLEELDPKGAKMTLSFKHHCVDTYGSILRAWTQVLDPENTNQVRLRQLEDRCRQMGWNGSAKHVYNFLNTNGLEELGPSSGYLTLADFDEDAWRAKQRGLKDCFTDLRVLAGARKHLPGSVKKPKLLSQTAIMGGTPNSNGLSQNSFGNTSPAKFGSSGKFSPGSTALSWGAASSPDNSPGGQSSPGGKAGMPGKVVPPKSDYMYIPDPNESCNITRSFIATIRRKFKSTRDCWYKALDPLGQTSLTFDQFLEACQKRIHYHGNADKVFRILDYQKSGMITMADFNPRAHECLKDIQFQLLNRFGSIIEAFHPYHLGTTNELDFESWCLMLVPFKFKMWDLKNVFDWLDVPKKGLIRGTAIEFAASGVPPKLTQISSESQERRQDKLEMRWEGNKNEDGSIQVGKNTQAETDAANKKLMKGQIEEPFQPPPSREHEIIDKNTQSIKASFPPVAAPNPNASYSSNNANMISPRPPSGSQPPGSRPPSGSQPPGSRPPSGSQPDTKNDSVVHAGSPRSQKSSSRPGTSRPGSANNSRKGASRGRSRPTSPDSEKRSPKHGLSASETASEKKASIAGDPSPALVASIDGSNPGNSPHSSPQSQPPAPVMAPTPPVPPTVSPPQTATPPRTAGSSSSDAKPGSTMRRVEFGKKPYPPEFSELQIQFLSHCKEKAGSLKAAWSQYLAPDGQSQIDFVTFCRGVRKLGFKGSLKQTWDSIGNSNEQGHMLCDDLDLQSSGALEEWKDTVCDAAGMTFLELYQSRGYPPQGIPCADFVDWMTETQLYSILDAENICGWLDSDGTLAERQYLKIEEIDANSAAMAIDELE